MNQIETEELKKFGRLLSKHWYEVNIEIRHAWEELEKRYNCEIKEDLGDFPGIIYH